MAEDVETSDRVVYTIPTAVALRGVGLGAVGLGLCVIGGTVLIDRDPGRGTMIGIGLMLIVASALALIVLVSGVLRLMGRGARLILDEDGFTNATGPGTGVRRVRWRDVRKVQTDGRFVSVDLAGSKRSLIRTNVLDVTPRQLAQQLRARLNRGHGIRPLR
ncbi:MAG TPA: hypothetical protein VFZ37_11495 [Jiangellaceae bacterium]